MRKDAALKRRLANVSLLQALRTAASRGELGDAQNLRAEAGDALAERAGALDVGSRHLDAMQQAEVLDFDRWRIGRAQLERLSDARDAAATELDRREGDESAARDALGHEQRREERAVALHRAVSRGLAEKRDDAAALEAGTLAGLRKAMARS